MSQPIAIGWELLIGIGLAGGAGAILRFTLSRFILQHLGATFPFGTFIVNVLGCLLFGLVWGLAENRGLLGDRARLILLVGFLGGFTTFSSFAYESLALIRDHQWGWAALNMAGQNVLGILFVAIGIALTRIQDITP